MGIFLGLAASPAWPDWMQLGECLNNTITSATLHLDITTYNNTPYVIMTESGWVHVKSYNGSNWQDIGSYLNVSPYPQARSQWPQIKIINGTPYAAWVEYDSALPAWHHIYAGKYNGGSWELIGNDRINDKEYNIIAGGPSLDIYNGTPYVAYNEEGLIYMKYFNGSQWANVGSVPVINTVQSGDSTACIVLAGTPYVSWRTLFTGLVYVKFFNGSGWELKGDAVNLGIGTYSDESYWYKAPLGQIDGEVYIVWYNNIVDARYVYTSRFNNGNGWETVGPAINNSRSEVSNFCRLAVVGSTPVVCWDEIENDKFQVQVKYYTGSEWKYVSENGRSLNLDAGNDAITSAIAAADNGNLYVAWREKMPNGQVYVKFYATPSYTPTVTVTPTVTMTSTISPTPTISATFTVSPTISPTRTSSPTPLRTATPSSTATLRPLLPQGGWAMPNPYVPGGGRKVTFNFRLDPPADFSIRIMNLRGRLVRTLENTNEWDGTAQNGQVCEAGVYIYQIESQNRRISGQIVVVK